MSKDRSGAGVVLAAPRLCPHLATERRAMGGRTHTVAHVAYCCECYHKETNIWWQHCGNPAHDHPLDSEE